MGGPENRIDWSIFQEFLRHRWAAGSGGTIGWLCEMRIASAATLQRETGGRE